MNAYSKIGSGTSADGRAAKLIIETREAAPFEFLISAQNLAGMISALLSTSYRLGEAQRTTDGAPAAHAEDAVHQQAHRLQLLASEQAGSLLLAVQIGTTHLALDIPVGDLHQMAADLAQLTGTSGLPPSGMH